MVAGSHNPPGAAWAAKVAILGVATFMGAAGMGAAGMGAAGMVGCGGASSSSEDRAPVGEAPVGEASPPVAASASAQTPPVAAPSLDPSTLPGSILFVSERDGNLEVYRWRANAPLERLTHDPRADFVAEVAPDGSGWTRVVTEDGATPEQHLEQLQWMPTQGEPVLVGPAGRRARGPSWAPDRSFVVFESDAEQAFSDLWRWSPGGTLQRLTTTAHGAFEPAIAPDGRSLAYVSTQDGNPELYLMALAGEAAVKRAGDADVEPRRLTFWRRDDMAPRWSPDGTRLAFLRREQGGERLFVLELQAGAGHGEPPARPVVATAEGEQVGHAEHAWSPDGTRLAYTVHRPRQAPQVVVTHVADGRTQVASPPGVGGTMPSWSPDGLALALTGTEGDPEALDLYVVRLEDGAWVRLTTTPAPDWLPRWTAH